MALLFPNTRSSYLSSATPIMAAPFTLMMNLRAATTDTMIAWIASDGSNNNRWQIDGIGGTQIDFTCEAGGSSGSATINTLDDITAGFHFLIARANSIANRLLAVLDNKGRIFHASNSTSLTPVGVTTNALGHSFAATFSWAGQIAEYCLVGADIQPDGLQLNEQLMRKLAFNGPFSVPHIKKDIIEYRSFRESPTATKKRDSYFGKGIQTWTNVGDVAIGPHPPLIRRSSQEPTLYAGVTSSLIISSPFSFTGTASFGFVGRATVASAGSAIGVAVFAAINASAASGGGTGSGQRGGMIANVGALMGH